MLLCGQLVTSSAVGDNKEIIPPKHVVVFDVWDYFKSAGITDTQCRADIIYMLTSLQGIVNREQPRLYLLTALSLFDLESKYNADPDRSTRPATEMAAWWLEWFQEKDCHVSTVRDGKFERMLDEVYARSAVGEETRLEAWRCILLTPTQITTVVEKKHPDAKVTIVDWPNLLQLKNQFLNP